MKLLSSSLGLMRGNWEKNRIYSNPVEEKPIYHSLKKTIFMNVETKCDIPYKRISFGNKKEWNADTCYLHGWSLKTCQLHTSIYNKTFRREISIQISGCLGLGVWGWMEGLRGDSYGIWVFLFGTMKMF